MKKITKSLGAVWCLILMSACANEPISKDSETVQRHQTETFPYTHFEDIIEGEEVYWRINDMKVVEIDHELKELIELRTEGLPVDVINHLQEEYMLLQVSFEAKVEDVLGEGYRKWESDFFRQIDFVRGDTLLDTSLMSVGGVITVGGTDMEDWINFDHTVDLGYTIKGVLLKREYAEDSAIQIRYNTSDGFIYFDRVEE